MAQGKTFKYTLGLDIGIASVGWALLADDHIINLGVRAFDKGETADKGESLNLTRRTARLARRRLRRRSQRLRKLTRLLIKHRLIDSHQTIAGTDENTETPWELRVTSLEQKLEKDEWARVIYHVCKHRGFHWVSKADRAKMEADSKGEGGRVKQGLASTKQKMEEHKYRTVGEMILKEFPEGQRNKAGQYDKSLSRVDLASELTKLFKKQREFGSTYASEELEAAVLGDGDQKTGLLWQQHPPLSGKDLLAMVGKCTFEKEHYRAPKHSFSAERFVWLTKLINLRINNNGNIRALTPEEHLVLVNYPFIGAERITFKSLRKQLTKNTDIDPDFRFERLNYPAATDTKAKDPENETFLTMKGFHQLKKIFNSENLTTLWEKLVADSLEGKTTQLDDIAWVLSIYKEDDEIVTALSELDLPEAATLIPALLPVSFDKFQSLSLIALRKILPEMAQGKRYDEACIAAGYHHSVLHEIAEKQRLLPPLYSGRNETGGMVLNEEIDNIPRNPVVLKALNQTRKIINDIIRRYGPPERVHIEMARDLSRPMSERKKIERAQKQYREANEQNRNQFEETFHQKANGRDMEKWRLYREQDGVCAYSLEPLDLKRLFEEGYVEVDHVLPYSRSFDDSKANKVLVKTKMNRDKGNMTPYEFLDGKNNATQWHRYEVWVNSNKKYRQAKRNRLLRKNFGKEEGAEFRERNLNDTRYICRFLKNYIEQYLQLHEDSDAKRCLVVNGQLTNFLRRRWGLLKAREENDRHHALDAVVVAACNHSMVKRLADYSRRKELEKARTGLVDLTTGEVVNRLMLDQLEKHFPTPWNQFRNELTARLYCDNIEAIRNQVRPLGTYSEEEVTSLRPLFVSRAPKRRNGGAAHKETIYKQPQALKDSGGATQRIPLTQLKLKDIEQLVEPERNKTFYAALRTQLEEFDDKPEKAFATENPFHKPDKHGNPTGPIVRAVTREIAKQTGIPVRGGIAANDTMVRVDVFAKNGKYFLVPVYIHQVASGSLPVHAIISSKPETEWTEINESYGYCFPLYPNDLVKLEVKGRHYFGYFAGADRSTGAIHLWVHDRSETVSKNGLIRGIGVKSAQCFERWFVDALGETYPAPTGMPRELA